MRKYFIFQKDSSEGMVVVIFRLMNNLMLLREKDEKFEQVLFKIYYNVIQLNEEENFFRGEVRNFKENVMLFSEKNRNMDDKVDYILQKFFFVYRQSNKFDEEFFDFKNFLFVYDD